jgi:uncharacterized membrane protein YkvA (DUF1232 family)
VVWRILLGLFAALVVAWAVLVVFLLIAKPKGSLAKEAVRLLPDTLRLLRRLAADRTLPRGVRIRLWVGFAYLAFPFDPIPDFLPVIGYADDAIVVSLVLRSVVRRAGPDAVRRLWPGTDDGLAVLWRVARLPGASKVEAGA